MFSVTIRDHFMIAHSLRGEVFGPAQGLHGATYVVDATFRRATLDADGVVVDIGRAGEVLRAVLGELGYRNLDDEAELAEHGHTLEEVARYVMTLTKAQLAGGFTPEPGTEQEIAIPVAIPSTLFRDLPCLPERERPE